jgi:hypothetical protein
MHMPGIADHSRQQHGTARRAGYVLSAVPQSASACGPARARAVFITDMGQLAMQHPYVLRPTTQYCCSWLGGMLCALVIGFGCFESEDESRWQAALRQARPAAVQDPR